MHAGIQTRCGLPLRPRPPPAPLHAVIHAVPKPAALLKPRKSSAWPGFKQQCSWDLLHFRQTALSVSLAINSPCGCLPLPRKGVFFFLVGSGKTQINNRGKQRELCVCRSRSAGQSVLLPERSYCGGSLRAPWA